MRGYHPRVSEKQATVISLAERRARAQAEAAEAERARARQQARRGDGQAPAQPWLTYALLGTNTAFWIVMVALGVDFYAPDDAALLRWGGNLGSVTASGEWWRLLSAMFVHGGIVHLAFDLLFMWLVGRDAERIFGPAAFALIYFGSGLVAGEVAIAVAPTSLRVGASGALFGVFAAFVAFTHRRRDVLPPEYVAGVRRNAAILVGISLLLGLLMPGFGLVALIAGLVVGLGIGYSITRLAERPVATSQEARALRLRTLGLTAGATILIVLAGILGLSR